MKRCHRLANAVDIKRWWRIIQYITRIKWGAITHIFCGIDGVIQVARSGILLETSYALQGGFRRQFAIIYEPSIECKSTLYKIVIHSIKRL